MISTAVREIRTDESGQVRDFQPRTGSVVNILNEILGEQKFWRFLIVTVLFLGVKSNFHHMDATFPKYFTREFGADTPYELVIAINPVLIIVLVPVVTYLLDRFQVGFRNALLIGGLIP